MKSERKVAVGILAGAIALAVAPGVAHAVPPPQPSAGTDDLLGRPIVLVVALALVSLLPFVFMSVTAFVKISTVLQIVKSAIGAQNVPSNTVIMALAASLTLLAMAPVGDKIWTRAAPLFEGKDVPDTVTLVRGGIDAVREPMRDFLYANASGTERTRFLEVAKESRPEAERDKVGEKDISVLVPAFVVTELTEAFALGFLLYLPFLIIDLVVSNILLALGMQMLNPTQVSLPFKLLLFVAIDGWGLLARALVAGYR
jgi:type III secretion protein R